MGFGDDIMATAEAREAKKNNPNTNIVIGDGKKIFNSVIFLNNPNIYQKDELNDNEKFNLTVDLTRWMSPYLFFIGLSAFSMGVLNSLKVFCGDFV